MGILLQSLALQAAEPVGDYSADVTPPPRSVAASPATLPRVLGLPAAYRAIQILAGVGSMLTLQVWKAGQLLDPIPSLFRQPDPWRSLESWLERVIVCLATDGNCFLRHHKDANGRVIALQVLNPYLVQVQWQDGVKSYDLTTRKGLLNLSASEVTHLWLLEIPGLDRGLSPIAACRAALTGVLATRDYADTWFGDGGSGQDVPSGVLSTDQTLTPGEAAEYKKIWREAGASNSGPSVRVLGKGLHYSPIMLKPADAQWIESQRWGVLEVARMFGMPADYLLTAVEGTSLTYRSLEMIDTQFLRVTLFPGYLRKIEAALTQVAPNGQTVRFDAAAVLRPDARTRAEIDRVYLAAGVISADEVRKREGWPGQAPRKAEV